MNILNFTQHAATPEQVDAGVVDPCPKMREFVSQLLTFEQLPSDADVRERAMRCAMWAGSECEKIGAVKVMIGGAPFFMERLAAELRNIGLVPVYAFSRRESVEETLPDGSVRKVSKFVHLGFVGE